MDTNQIAESEVLLRTTERMVRVGLIVDRHCLSAANRRALFVLQCQYAENDEDEDNDNRPKIGFRYPNAR